MSLPRIQVYHYMPCIIIVKDFYEAHVCVSLSLSLSLSLFLCVHRLHSYNISLVNKYGFKNHTASKNDDTAK